MYSIKTEFPDFSYGYLKRYGLPGRVWYSQFHPGNEVITIANITGKCTLYIGLLGISSNVARWTDRVEITIDGTVVFSELWGWIWLYHLLNIPNYPLTIVCFDTVLHYYTAVIECNYTFEESFFMTYETRHIVGNTTVNFELLYGKIE